MEVKLKGSLTPEAGSEAGVMNGFMEVHFRQLKGMATAIPFFMACFSMACHA